MKKYFILLLLTLLVIAGCTQTQPSEQKQPDISRIITDIPSQPSSEPTVPPAPPAPTPEPTPLQTSIPELLIIRHTKYDPDTIVVPLHQRVKLKVIAAPGTARHNHGITIDEYGLTQAVTTEDPNNPQIIEFTANQAGTFTIYCKTCWDGPFGRGHPDIRATLIVQ